MCGDTPSQQDVNRQRWRDDITHPTHSPQLAFLSALPLGLCGRSGQQIVTSAAHASAGSQGTLLGYLMQRWLPSPGTHPPITSTLGCRNAARTDQRKKNPTVMKTTIHSQQKSPCKEEGTCRRPNPLPFWMASWLLLPPRWTDQRLYEWQVKVTMPRGTTLHVGIGRKRTYLPTEDRSQISTRSMTHSWHLLHTVGLLNTQNVRFWIIYVMYI